MSTYRGDERIIEMLKLKKEQLEDIKNVACPLDPKRVRGHYRKVGCAENFLEELGKVFDFLEDFTIFEDRKVELVPFLKFQNQIEKANFVTWELNGEFCKIVTIQNFPSEEEVGVIYIAPTGQL